MTFPKEVTFNATELRTSTKRILDCVEDEGLAYIVNRSREPMVVITENRIVDLLLAQWDLERLKEKGASPKTDTL